MSVQHGDWCNPVAGNKNPKKWCCCPLHDRPKPVCRQTFRVHDDRWQASLSAMGGGPRVPFGHQRNVNAHRLPGGQRVASIPDVFVNSLRDIDAHAYVPMDIDPVFEDDLDRDAVDVMGGRAKWGSELYPGAQHTVLDAVAMVLKPVAGLSIERKTDLFDVISELLPKPNNWPRYGFLHNQIKELTPRATRLRTCPHNCCLFWDFRPRQFMELLLKTTPWRGRKLEIHVKMFSEFVFPTELDQCPKCGSDTFTNTAPGHSREPTNFIKELILTDVTSVIPLWFRNPDFSPRWNIKHRHDRTIYTGPDSLYSSHDWKKRVVDKDLHLGNNGRDLILTRWGDGINPYGKNHTHSSEVFGAYCMNLPFFLRQREEYVLVKGILGGPEHPTKLYKKVRTCLGIQPYLMVMFIGVLQTRLPGGGIPVEDYHYPRLSADRHFKMRVHVIWSEGDFPALSLEYNTLGATALNGCVTGGPNCTGKHSTLLSKVCHADMLRELPHNHPLRAGNGQAPVQDRTFDSLWQSIEEWYQRVFEDVTPYTDRDWKRWYQNNGIYGYSASTVLGLHPGVSVIYDFPHIMKVLFDRFIAMMGPDSTSNSKATLSAQLRLERPDLAIEEQEHEQKRLPWALTRHEHAVVDERCANILAPAKFKRKVCQVFKKHSSFTMKDKVYHAPSSITHMHASPIDITYIHHDHPIPNTACCMQERFWTCYCSHVLRNVLPATQHSVVHALYLSFRKMRDLGTFACICVRMCVLVHHGLYVPCLLLCACAGHQQDLNARKKTYASVIATLACYEKLVPRCQHVMIFHIMKHIAKRWLDMGTVPDSYGLERKQGALTFATNAKRKVEVGMINSMATHSWFMKYANMDSLLQKMAQSPSTCIQRLAAKWQRGWSSPPTAKAVECKSSASSPEPELTDQQERQLHRMVGAGWCIVSCEYFATLHTPSITISAKEKSNQGFVEYMDPELQTHQIGLVKGIGRVENENERQERKLIHFVLIEKLPLVDRANANTGGMYQRQPVCVKYRRFKDDREAPEASLIGLCDLRYQVFLGMDTAPRPRANVYEVLHAKAFNKALQ